MAVVAANNTLISAPFGCRDVQNAMSDSEPLVLSGDGVTVQKSFHESVYPSPAVVFHIEHWAEEPQTVTIAEPLPAAADGTLIEFHGETADNWTATDDELRFEITLTQAGGFETAYSYAGGFENPETWLAEPTVSVTTTDAAEPTVLTVQEAATDPLAFAVGSDGAGADASSETLVYGDGLAYEPEEPEEVQPGDVYGQDEAHPFEDHESVAPDDLYGEVESRWADDSDVVDASYRYGEDDAYEPETPEAVKSGRSYGQADAIDE